MSDNQHVTVQLLPGTTLLTILFVLLKVYGKIDWSWWWVFSPLWIPFAIFLGVMAFVALIAIIIGAYNSM